MLIQLPIAKFPTIKQGNLPALFCHGKIPNDNASCWDLGTVGKPLVLKVHQGDFIICRSMVRKLLNIE
jgi:hypothetical protein